MQDLSKKTGCVIMASGISSRFGSDKLFADFNGKPLFSYILSATDIPGLKRLVVTRNKETAEKAQRAGCRVILHGLSDISDTIRLGTEFFSGAEKDRGDEENSVSSVIFCTADQPLLSRKSVERLIAESFENPGKICRLSFGKAFGSPVLFPKKYFEELKKLNPGESGRDIIKRHKEDIIFVEAASPEELFDIDTKEDLEKLVEEMLKNR